ncbi:MAG: DMT family transporter [Halanaerobiales bacterium]
MSKTKGIFFVILSAFSFGFIPLFASIAYANGFNPFTFSLFRSLFAAVELYIFIKINKINYRLEKSQLLTLFKISFFGYTLLMVMLVMSYNYIATGLAMTLHFIYPVVVMLASIVIYNEKVDWRKITALIIAFIGIYFLVGFDSTGEVNIIGVSLALLSGILYAYYIIMVSGESLKDVSPYVIVFYISLFNTYILFFESLFLGQLSLEYNYTGLLSTVGVATVCNLFGMVALQKGLKVVTPSTATILSTLEPITSMVIGVLFLNELFCWYHIIGSIFVLFSVIIVALVERQNTKVIT